MTPHSIPAGTTRLISRSLALALALALTLPHLANAQTSTNNPPVTGNVPITREPNSAGAKAPEPTAAAAARNTAVNTIEEVQGTPLKKSLVTKAEPGPREGLVTVVGSGTAVSEGARVLRVPAACTPKTNSLDCVADANQATQGGNVSSRVRNSVIGEVGAGKAATEGGGSAKRQGECTPQPGKLECAP